MRARREALTRDRILAAAVELVDREGLDVISMRRLGEALGVEAMSLYHHVANKAAILDGVFERILDELAPARAHAAWQAVVRDRAIALRDVLRLHPNALPLFATRPAVTPAAIAHLEPVFAAVRGAGFTAHDTLSIVQAVIAFVVGHAIATYAPQPDAGVPAYDQLAATELPRVRELASILEAHDFEHDLELGVDAMLAGFALRPHSRGRTP